MKPWPKRECSARRRPAGTLLGDVGGARTRNLVRRARGKDSRNHYRRRDGAAPSAAGRDAAGHRLAVATRGAALPALCGVRRGATGQTSLGITGALSQLDDSRVRMPPRSRQPQRVGLEMAVPEKRGDSLAPEVRALLEDRLSQAGIDGGGIAGWCARVAATEPAPAAGAVSGDHTVSGCPPTFSELSHRGSAGHDN